MGAGRVQEGNCENQLTFKVLSKVVLGKGFCLALFPQLIPRRTTEESLGQCQRFQVYLQAKGLNL